MMKNTARNLHPMTCTCRACRDPRQTANITPRQGLTLHPIAKAIASCTAFWVFIAASAFLIWGAGQ